MKKFNQLVVFSLLFFIHSTAQNKTTVLNTKNSTTICGLTSEGNGGTISETEPLILYIVDSATNKKIEIVFTQNVRQKMSYNPDNKLVNQHIYVTGKLSSYNKNPAIIIQSEKQIKIKSVAEVNDMNANEQ